MLNRFGFFINSIKNVENGVLSAVTTIIFVCLIRSIMKSLAVFAIWNGGRISCLEPFMYEFCVCVLFFFLLCVIFSLWSSNLSVFVLAVFIISNEIEILHDWSIKQLKRTKTCLFHLKMVNLVKVMSANMLFDLFLLTLNFKCKLLRHYDFATVFFLLLFSSFWLFSNEHTTFEQLPNTHTSNQHKSKIDRTQLITWNIFCTCYYYGQIRWKKIRTHKSMVTWENSWKLAECLLKPKVFWFEGKVIRFHNNQCTWMR